MIKKSTLFTLSFILLSFQFAKACLEIPTNPPDVLVIDTDINDPFSIVEVIIEDYTTYGGTPGDYCACALNLPATYGQVTTATIVYANSYNPLPGWSFAFNPLTGPGFGGNNPNDWQGFSSAVSEAIASGVEVDIIFEVFPGGINTLTERAATYAEDIKNYLETAPFVIGTSGADNQGIPDTGAHFSTMPANSVTLIGGTLPLDLLSFKGHIQNDQVALEWVTANEEDFNGFLIERSTDGLRFEGIHWMDAQGETSTEKVYTYKDAPAQFNTAYYYRLKMVDLDQSFRYSNIVTVSLPLSEAGSVFIQPNVVKDKFNVFIDNPSTESTANIQLFNSAGQLVKSFTRPLTEGLQQLNLDIFGLASGLHFVAIRFDEYSVSRKIMVQH